MVSAKHLRKKISSTTYVDKCEILQSDIEVHIIIHEWYGNKTHSEYDRSHQISLTQNYWNERKNWKKGSLIFLLADVFCTMCVQILYGSSCVIHDVIFPAWYHHVHYFYTVTAFHYLPPSPLCAACVSFISTKCVWNTSQVDGMPTPTR